jgi:hypothetical protein
MTEQRWQRHPEWQDGISSTKNSFNELTGTLRTINLTNNQMQRFLFSSLTLQKEYVDADIFPNPLTARLRPVNYRPVFGANETLIENVVGKVGQRIKVMFGQFDALNGRWARRMAMSIDVFEPEAGWYVLFVVRLMTAQQK